MSTVDTVDAVPNSYLYYRHTAAVRIMHWINVIALTVLLMSGLNIFSAHPALYWGQSSYSGRPPVLEIGAMEDADNVTGVTRILGRDFDTTGLLGASHDASGEIVAATFPSWLTIPGNRWLSLARQWHFLFAWIFADQRPVLCRCIRSGAGILRAISRRPAADWRSIGRSIIDHLRFHHPTGEASKRYNVLQKIAYLTVIFVLLPLVILMGFAMSPGLDSVIPGWVNVVGGRQSARTIHFVVAWLLVAFVFIHVFEVIITGLWNNLRSMITGRYRVEGEAKR